MFFDQLPHQGLDQEFLSDIEIVEYSPGRRFCRFNEHLEQTPLATSYKGYDAQSGRQISWNVIQLHRFEPCKARVLINNIRLLKGLNHPNIIQYLDSWASKSRDQFILVTELANGGCLSQYLKKIRKPKLRIVKGWCLEILGATQYVHQRHPKVRIDFRCSNIYINANSNQLKLGFRCFVPTDCMWESPENIPWTAPEVCDNQRSRKSQVYSFGMTLLELLTGKEPYHECQNYLQVLKNVIWKTKPPQIGRIRNLQLKGIIDSCLQNQSQRPSFCELRRLPFWDRSPDDQSPVQVQTKQSEQDGIKLSKSEASKTKNFVSKPSNGSMKAESEFEASFCYKTQKNKRFSLTVGSFQNERNQFQDFVRFLICKLEAPQVSIDYSKEALQHQMTQSNQCLETAKSVYLQKYKEYSVLVENLLVDSPCFEDLLARKEDMERRQLEAAQREERLRLVERNTHSRKSQSLGLDWFDVMNFHISSTADIKESKKALSTASDILSLTYSSIHHQNKSQKSEDFEFDLEKINIQIPKQMAPVGQVESESHQGSRISNTTIQKKNSTAAPDLKTPAMVLEIKDIEVSLEVKL